MSNLPGTYSALAGRDVGRLHREIARGVLSGNLYVVGAGGSLVAAHFIARLHAAVVGRQAQAVSTLEFLDVALCADDSVVVVSAGGRNQDALRALRHALDQEGGEVVLVTCRPDSPAAKLGDRIARLRVFVADEMPKDGFLATNSLMATIIAWHQAVAAAAHLPALPHEPPWRLPPLEGSNALSRPFLLALGSGWSALGPLDLESRCSEAGLSAVQVSDWRNFAHGRHQWFENHGDETVVVAFIADQSREIAHSTLDLLPAGIPIVRLEAEGSGPQAAVSAIAHSMLLAQAIGQGRLVDPGRPTVSAWGRRAYHLGPPSRTPRRSRAVAPNNPWSKSTIEGVVLDYDGTLVETPNRFDPPSDELAMELARVSSHVKLGIATGRGKSVQEALRQVLPEPSWRRVVIGYYNGSQVIPLSEARLPDGSDDLRDDALQALSRSVLAEVLAPVEATLRPHQLSLSGPGFALDHLQGRIAELCLTHPTLRCVRSSTSIDVLGPAASKSNVVAAVAGSRGVDAVLRIGDMGGRDGNDRELLAHPLGLSVQWPVGRYVGAKPTPPSMRGTDATLAILRALVPIKGGVRLKPHKGWSS